MKPAAHSPHTMIGNRGGDSPYNDHWLSNCTIRLYTLNSPVFSDRGRVIGMGKRNKSTPPLIVDTIHTMKTMIKYFCQLCNQTCLVTHLYNLAPFLWLNFIALFCICYKEKPRIHHLDIRESRNPFYDHGQFLSKL